MKNIVEELLQKIKFVLECKNNAQAERIIEKFIFHQEEYSKQKCIEFAKWSLKQIKKAPSGKKFVFKHQNKVVADEHTMEEMYNIFIIDKNYNL